MIVKFNQHRRLETAWIVEEGNNKALLGIILSRVMRILFMLLLIRSLWPAGSPDISRSIVTVSFFFHCLHFYTHVWCYIWDFICDLCLLLSFCFISLFSFRNKLKQILTDTCTRCLNCSAVQCIGTILYV